MEIDTQDITFEALVNLLVVSLIVIYVVLPKLGPIFYIFDFIANLIVYSVYGILGFIGLQLVIELAKQIMSKIEYIAYRYDPRIAKDLEF